MEMEEKIKKVVEEVESIVNEVGIGVYIKKLGKLQKLGDKYVLRTYLGDYRKKGEDGYLFALELERVDEEDLHGRKLYTYVRKHDVYVDDVVEDNSFVIITATGSWNYPGTYARLCYVHNGELIEICTCKYNTRTEKALARCVIAEIVKRFNGNVDKESEIKMRLEELIERYGKEKVLEVLDGLLT